MILLPPSLTKRQLRKAKREHHGLKGTYRKAPWWHYAQGYYTVTCSCGWTDPEEVPVYPTQDGGSFVSDLGLNLAMNRHLEEAYRGRVR